MRVSGTPSEMHSERSMELIRGKGGDSNSESCSEAAECLGEMLPCRRSAVIWRHGLGVCLSTETFLSTSGRTTSSYQLSQDGGGGGAVICRHCLMTRKKPETFFEPFSWTRSSYELRRWGASGGAVIRRHCLTLRHNGRTFWSRKVLEKSSIRMG